MQNPIRPSQHHGQPEVRLLGAPQLQTAVGSLPMPEAIRKGSRIQNARMCNIKFGEYTDTPTSAYTCTCTCPHIRVGLSQRRAPMIRPQSAEHNAASSLIHNVRHVLSHECPPMTWDALDVHIRCGECHAPRPPGQTRKRQAASHPPNLPKCSWMGERIGRILCRMDPTGHRSAKVDRLL